MSISRAKTGVPMQPGEEDWASFKCGGGPHSPEIEAQYHPAVKSIEQLHRIGAVVLPYAGERASLSDYPVRPDVKVLYSVRANMPA